MRALPAVAALVLGAACATPSSPPRPPTAPSPPTPPAASLPATTRPTLAPLPAQAEAVARGYARAALSYRYDQGPGAWVQAVAAVSTPAWAARLGAESDAGGGWWAGVVGRREVAEATVVAVHPAHGLGPGRQAVVVARVVVGGAEPGERIAVVSLDLLPTDAGWRVAAAT